MISFLLRIWATLSLAAKRLATQRSLALAAAAGLATAAALVLAVPLYADATQFRLLRQQLVGERGSATYAPITLSFHYSGATDNPPQWADGQPVDAYLSSTAEAQLGLPTLLMARRFSTDALQLYPPLDPNNPQSKYFVTWSHFAFVNRPDQLITLVSGAYPAGSESASAPVDALMNDTTAQSLGIRPGDLFFARRDTVEIPVRISGTWLPADPSLPIWSFKPEDTLLVPEGTYVSRVAPAVKDELFDAAWVVTLSGSNLHASDVAGLLAQLQNVAATAAHLMPGTKLAAAPVTALADYENRAPALTLLLYAFSAPILGLILVFLGLVAGMFVDQLRNEIAVLRSRGATAFQVAGMTAMQGATLGALALAVGIPLGELVALAIGRSRSFMDFSTPTKLRIALVPAVLGLGLGAVAAVLLAQFVLPALGAARNTIVTYKNERARSVRAPWWQRAGVDFLLLIPAAYGAYTLYHQRALVAANKLQVPDPLQNPALILVPALGIFALTLVVLRLMPAAMAAIAGLLARTRSVGLLMAARFLARTPAFYSAPLVLLIFTLSLSVFTASIAQTLDHHLTRQIGYENGADLTLQDNGILYNSPDSMSPSWDFVDTARYRQVPGVQAVSRVGRYQASVMEAGAGGPPVTYLGVDRDTFPQVAYWQSDFAPASLGALMNALAAYPNGVLVSRGYLAAHGWKLGDSLTVGVQTPAGSAALQVIIAGVVDLFPSWYPENGPLLVGNLDTLFQAARAPSPHEVWLKTAPRADPESIIYAVRGYSIMLDLEADQSRLVKDGLNTFVGSWSSAGAKLIQEQQRPERQGLFGLLSVGFATTALLTVLGFILYALFSFRRRFIELGMLRAVGLSAGQMTRLLAGELVFLVATGLVVGTGVGVLCSQWFIPYLQVGASLSAHYPPFRVEIAWGAIAEMYVLFGVLFVGALAGLAGLLLRMKVFQAVKLGETT